MNILIVDDDYKKFSEILSVIKEVAYEDSNINIFEARDANTAKRHLIENHINFLVIDIRLPISQGEEPDDNGGINLLEYIKINNNISVPDHILGVTAFSDIYDKVNTIFGNDILSIIVCDPTSDNWKKQLFNKFSLIYRSFVVKEIQHYQKKYDIALVTALDKVELEAVRRLNCNWERFRVENDPTIYYAGTILTESKNTLSIVAASALHMGMTASSSLTTKMILQFNPKYVVMTGISAGIQGKVNIGDILVADPSWNWGNGKVSLKDNLPDFESSPYQMSLSAEFRAIFRELETSKEFLDPIYRAWPSEKPNTPLNMHIGPVASGPVVLANKAIADSIKVQHRDLLGIEMEAYGVMSACKYALCQKPESFIIKSVCDFADHVKNDNWQSFAAYTSASYFYHVAKKYL